MGWGRVSSMGWGRAGLIIFCVFPRFGWLTCPYRHPTGSSGSTAYWLYCLLALLPTGSTASTGSTGSSGSTACFLLSTSYSLILKRTNRRNVNLYPKDSHPNNKSKLQQNHLQLKLPDDDLANLW
jgi:hypothetical protein